MSDIGETVEIVVGIICLSNEIIVTVSIFGDDLANRIVSIIHPLIALSVNSQTTQRAKCFFIQALKSADDCKSKIASAKSSSCATGNLEI